MTQDTEGAPYDIQNDDLDTLYVAFLTGHIEGAVLLQGLGERYENAAWRDRKALCIMLDTVTAAMEGNAQ